MIKREFIEAGVLLGAVALAIYLTKGDKILSTLKNKRPMRTGSNGGFENFTEDEMVFDDHLYAEGNKLFGLKFK